MKYGSVCSGIEAATQAWKPLGWSPVFFSEIEKFPSAVLAHHYGSNMPDDALPLNGVPNYGDITKFKEWPDRDTIDLLVGGTPCQSFSIAGLRQGLNDPRGNLMLTYLALTAECRAKWLVWENVPGVLSSNKGRDFGAFLGALAELGYGFAYRVLDTQYVRVDGFERALPQRRRRVFVIGYFGDWRPAAAVLFDEESLHGNTAPIRSKRPKVTRRPETSVASGKPTFGTLMANAGSKLWLGNQEAFSGDYHILETQQSCHDVASTLTVGADQVWGRTCGQPIASTLTTECGNPGSNNPTFVHGNAIIRRITPKECERLQGFPDDFTKIAWRGKASDECPDGPRYKALGNSMSVNVMRWIGRRIEMINSLSSQNREVA